MLLDLGLQRQQQYGRKKETKQIFVGKRPHNPLLYTENCVTHAYTDETPFIQE